MSDFAFDPDEARVFMQVLTESSENARESVATLAASKNELHTTFAGNEKYVKYETQSDEMIFELQQFSAKIEESIAYLGHLISLADEYFDNN